MDTFIDSDLKVSSPDVLKSYLDFKIEDIEEFAAAYTYQRHDVTGNLDDMGSKERMYKKVCEILLPLKEKGLLQR